MSDHPKSCICVACFGDKAKREKEEALQKGGGVKMQTSEGQRDNPLTSPEPPKESSRGEDIPHYPGHPVSCWCELCNTNHEKCEWEIKRFQLRAEQAEAKLKPIQNLAEVAERQFNHELDRYRSECDSHLHTLQEVKDLQSKLNQAEQEAQTRLDNALTVQRRDLAKAHDETLTELDRVKSCSKEAYKQLQLQNSAMREALAELIRCSTHDHEGVDRMLACSKARELLSTPPTTQDWVRIDRVVAIIKCLSIGDKDRALTLAKELGLEK